ncbi:MAG: Rrf2 family transcriptional regulator [Chloroflexota bacterium]|nr:Rrf2 family transcriptional regulator [Chloroflexota bacterium]
MKITAKADYAVRATAELAASRPNYVTAEKIALAQSIPQPFLTSILQALRRAGIVESRRGADGGHRLAMEAKEVTIADVIRVIEGPLAGVAGRAPEDLSATGAAVLLPQVWVATRSALREVLEVVTFDDVVTQRLPTEVRRRLDAPGAWRRR